MIAEISPLESSKFVGKEYNSFPAATYNSSPSKCIANEVLGKSIEPSVLKLLQEEHADVYQVQVLVQQLPILRNDPRRVLEPQERQEIKRAQSIGEIFSILSVKYMSYENFGLLKGIAETLCNEKSKPLSGESTVISIL